MIARSGLALSIPIMFATGHPDGDVTWRLFDAAGAVLASGAVVVPADAVSINIPIAPIYNTLTGNTLFTSRDIEWSYLVSGAVVNDEQRYTIEARAPYGASPDGVRAKLGVENADLPDDDISLIRAYLSFRSVVTPEALALVTSDSAQLSIRDAIEAQAALSLIPTMAVRVAVSEDSGTNSYKRQNIDWALVAEALSAAIADGILAVLPAYDPTPTGLLFILAKPAADPITGGTYT